MNGDKARKAAVFKLGVGPLIAALDKHKGQAKAIYHVCRALHHLAHKSKARGAAIVAMGAVPLLASVRLDQHEEGYRVRLALLDALGYTEDGDAKYEARARSGGVGGSRSQK